MADDELVREEPAGRQAMSEVMTEELFTPPYDSSPEWAVDLDFPMDRDRLPSLSGVSGLDDVDNPTARWLRSPDQSAPHLRSNVGYLTMRDMTVEEEPLERELHGQETIRSKNLPTHGRKRFYRFFDEIRSVDCSYEHFQLRNLVWATSPHDVYVMGRNGVTHWDTSHQRRRRVLQTSWTDPVGRVQISTMVVKDSILAIGGYGGELVAKRVDCGEIIFSGRIAEVDCGITNALDIISTPSGNYQLMCCSNDCRIRLFDVDSFKLCNSFLFPFPVNHATLQPEFGKVLCVGGDDFPIVIADSQTGETLLRLEGHRDFSFATAWHPNGFLCVTGNQDRTSRVWDIRYPKTSLCVLNGDQEAIRALRFSNDGSFLFMSESADLVHIFDVAGGTFSSKQELTVFGAISGISCAPGSDVLFVGVVDQMHGSSLTQYEAVSPRMRHTQMW